jgi:Xaa-Pro aminopeptidase
VVEKQRWVKEPGELESLRRAIALTDDAFTWLTTWLQPGTSERAVAWELEKYMRERGAEELSFDIIAASGPNSALPHAHPTERVLQAGEPFTIDMGAVVDGYHADLTRTVCLGAPDDTFLKIYGVVLEAQLAAEHGLHAGITGKQADALARDVIAAAGYGDYFGHSLGHGVGLVTHEGPGLSPRSEDDPVPAGATVTVEPGIYIPGWGGVRIEDIVLVGAEDVEVLSQASKEPGLALAATA